MLTLLILSTLGFLMVVNLILRTWKRRNLPPGPIRWPGIGNIIEMMLADKKYPHIALAKLAEKYGDVMSFGLGAHDAVVLSSHEVMKDLLPREALCESRYDFPYVPDRTFHKNLGLIWSSNHVWREMRRFTFKAMKDFGFGKRRSMEALLQDEMDDMVASIKTNAENNGGILLIDNLTLAFHSISILWSFVGGHRFRTGDEKVAKTIKLNEVVFQILGPSNIYAAFPYLKDWFPTLSQHEHHKKLHKENHEFFKEIIDDAKKSRSDRLDQNPDNFIELFLDEINKNSDNPDSMFTEEQLIVILSDISLGGSDTSSGTLRWAVLYLTKNPEVQRKIQLEIKKELGEGPISLSDAARLPYLKATMFEIFRIQTLAPIPGPRKATADIFYKGYTIPKGSLVMFNLYPVLNDKEYWKDPEVFRPERFLDATRSKVINTERVTVFGFGKRICPAESFVMDFLFVFTATLLRTFSFHVPDGEKISADNPIVSLAMVPRDYKVKVIINQ